MAKGIFLIIFISASFFLVAQEPVSIQLSEKNGLPDKEFYDVIEDDNGFVWLCADKGLFRYDGKVFEKYTSTYQRGLSVFYLQEDSLNRIWCTNISGQFFYIENDKLRLFIDLSTELNGELAQYVVTKTYLYVFTVKHIYQIDLNTKTVKIIHESKSRFGSPYKYKNATYFGSADSISCITSKNELKDLLATNLSDKNQEGVGVVQGKSELFKVNSSLFFRQNRMSKNKFYKINASKEKVENERIISQFENNNEIWFTTNSGIWVFEFKESKFQFKNRFLNGKSVTKIIKDRDANYWITTLNNGIYVVPNIYIKAYNISKDNKNITSLDKINDSTLIFGSANGNVSFYNTLTHNSRIVNFPTQDRVSTLKYIPNKDEVFVSKDLNAYVLDNKTLEVKSIKRFPTIKSVSILENSDLLFTDYSRVRTLKEADFSNKQTYISKNKRAYTSFYNDNNKDMYIAYVDNLILYDSIWNAKAVTYNNKAIYAKSITKTANGTIWVATFKDGVFGIKNNEVVEHYTLKNGLSSNHIEIVKADQNILWIASEKSIQALDVIDNNVQTLTKRDGIVSNDISGVEILKGEVFFASSEGLFSINKEQAFKSQKPEAYFNLLEINEKDTLISSGYQLKYNQNAIKIGFNVNGFLFSKKGRYRYRLKGFKEDWLITEIGENTVKYNSLPAGKYTFQVQPLLGNEIEETKIETLNFVIKKPFWKTWWFVLSFGVVILFSVVFYFRRKIKAKEEERIKQLEKIYLEKELISQNLTALRSQMNPHFIFNALNSIQDLVLKQDTEASYDYIVLFSELIRNTLSYSNQDFILIEKELDFLQVYLKLEKLRFGDDFNYVIKYEGEEGLEVPSLLIQPFIENALVHGLLHKSGKKELNIFFRFISEQLQCIIIDNGIGRVEAQKIVNRQGNVHESFALNAIRKRLDIFKKQYNNVGYVIEDLYEKKCAIGTKVIINMPFKKRF